MPIATWRPSTEPTTPSPVRDELRRLLQSLVRVSLAAATIRYPPGCSLPRSRRSPPIEEVPTHRCRPRKHGAHPGLAHGQCPGLVDHDRVDLFESSRASAFLIKDACSGAASPYRTMIDIGVARPSAQGAGDNQNRDCVDQRIGKPWFRPEGGPDRESQNRNGQDNRYEVGGDNVRQPLDRSTGALRSPPCGQSGRASSPSRRVRPS